MKRIYVTSAVLFALLLSLALTIRVAANVPFQGDSVAHVNIAKQIVEHGSISPYIDNLVYSDTGRPITYPQLFHTFLAVDYLFLGERSIHFIPCFFGLLICIVVFLLTRQLTKSSLWGALAILITITAGDFFRFSSFVFMESLLAFFCLLSIYLFIKVLQDRQKRLLVFLLGLFIGCAISTKTPGFFLLMIIPYYFLLRRDIKGSLLMIGGILLISSVFLGYQLHSNGTILDPGLAVKFQPHSKLAQMVDVKSLQAWEQATIEQSRIGYAHSLEGVKEFFLISNVPNGLALLLMLFVFVSPLVVDKKLRVGVIFLLLMLLVSFLAYQFVPNERYFFEYRLLVILIYTLWFSILFNWLRSIKYLKHARWLLLLSLLVISILQGFTNSSSWSDQRNLIIYQATNEGGYNNLIDAAHWLRDNSPDDAIVGGTPEEDIAYYSQRPVFWLCAYNGEKIPTLVKTHSESEALEICQEYDISYLWVGHYQIKEIVHPQFFPPDGIVSVIDEFQHFELVYRNNEIRIYKVGNT